METSPKKRVLVVANRTAATPRLLEEVRRRRKSGPCEFALLIPDVGDRKRRTGRLRPRSRCLSARPRGPVEGLIGGADPFTSVQDTVRDGRFDEIIISTLSKKASKWLRRDLVRKVEGLGLPVTAVMPRATAQQGITDTKAFDEWDDLNGRWRRLKRVLGGGRCLRRLVAVPVGVTDQRPAAHSAVLGSTTRTVRPGALTTRRCVPASRLAVWIRGCR